MNSLAIVPPINVEHSSVLKELAFDEKCKMSKREIKKEFIQKMNTGFNP